MKSRNSLHLNLNVMALNSFNQVVTCVCFTAANKLLPLSDHASVRLRSSWGVLNVKTLTIMMSLFRARPNDIFT